MGYRTPNSQLIELIVPVGASAGQLIVFQNQSQLLTINGSRKVRIEGIETYNNLHMSVSPITAGSPVAAPADIANATLSINSGGTLKYWYLPLVDLVRLWVDASGAGAAANNVHTRDLFELENLFQVDWTKTGVQLNAAPITNPPYSYLFNVYYDSTDMK